MKQRYFDLSAFLLIIACLISFLITGCGGGGGGGVTAAPAPIQKWTVMVYMVGSDLESEDNAGTNDLNEMMAVGSTNNLKVVVTTGGANKVGWTTVKRWLINTGSKTELSDLGNLNMGDPSTLQNFIVWAISNYPADKYVLILWDHGGGVIGGFGVDENNNDRLYLTELRQALEGTYNATGKTFEIIGFDACLMATTEVAYNMSPYGKYFVASEETEPGHGWNYTPILQAIINNSSIDDASLGRVIADGYKAQAEEWGNEARGEGQSYNMDKDITLSVIDLSKISSLITALDTLSVQINTNLQTIGVNAWIPVAEGRSKSEDYGNNESQNQFTDMADLKHLAQNLSASYPNETNAMITAINQAVVYKVNGSARPNANGLSIFLPYKYLNSTNLQTQIQSYNNVDFSASYKNMITNYSDLGDADDTPPTFANETLNDKTYSANVQGNDVDDVYVVITLSDPATGTITILGMESLDIGQNGYVSYEWTGQWLTLDGNFVSIFPIDEEDSIELLDIPALLNGETVDVLVLLDNDTGQYNIIGAWPGIENGMAKREILPIKQGDVITPLFISYNINTDSWEFLPGIAFTVGSSPPTPGISSLPAGNYWLGFYAVDYAQNDAESQFVSLSVQSAASASLKSVKIATASKSFKTTLAVKIMEKRKLR